MEFKLVYGNHGKDPVQVYETLLLIKFGLESLGHKADLEHNLSPGKTNILIESFSYDFLEVFREFSKTPGTDYIIVATEYLTGETFNQFGKPIEERDNMPHYENPRYWRKRYKTFLEANKYCRAVWHLSESQVQTYRQELGLKHVHYLPHGHVSQLERVHHQINQHKDIDVLFTGTPTAYRDQVISDLRRKGLSVKFSLPRSSVQREDLVGRAKLALNIKQSAEWKYPSNSRFHYHITNSSLVVSEKCEESCDLSKYVVETTSDHIFQVCDALISEDRYQAEATTRLEQFRTEMPMKRLASALLDSSYEK
jgi:hypothetical protein